MLSTVQINNIKDQAERRKIRNGERKKKKRGIYHIKGAFLLEICGLSPDGKIAYKG